MKATWLILSYLFLGITAKSDCIAYRIEGSHLPKQILYVDIVSDPILNYNSPRSKDVCNIDLFKGVLLGFESVSRGKKLLYQKSSTVFTTKVQTLKVTFFIQPTPPLPQIQDKNYIFPKTYLIFKTKFKNITRDFSKSNIEAYKVDKWWNDTLVQNTLQQRQNKFPNFAKFGIIRNDQTGATEPDLVDDDIIKLRELTYDPLQDKSLMDENITFVGSFEDPNGIYQHQDKNYFREIMVPLYSHFSVIHKIHIFNNKTEKLSLFYEKMKTEINDADGGLTNLNLTAVSTSENSVDLLNWDTNLKQSINFDFQVDKNSHIYHLNFTINSTDVRIPAETEFIVSVLPDELHYNQNTGLTVGIDSEYDKYQSDKIYPVEILNDRIVWEESDDLFQSDVVDEIIEIPVKQKHKKRRKRNAIGPSNSLNQIDPTISTTANLSMEPTISFDYQLIQLNHTQLTHRHNFQVEIQNLPLCYHVGFEITSIFCHKILGEYHITDYPEDMTADSFDSSLVSSTGYEFSGEDCHYTGVVVKNTDNNILDISIPEIEASEAINEESIHYQDLLKNNQDYVVFMKLGLTKNLNSDTSESCPEIDTDTLYRLEFNNPWQIPQLYVYYTNSIIPNTIGPYAIDHYIGFEIKTYDTNMFEAILNDTYFKHIECVLDDHRSSTVPEESKILTISKEEIQVVNRTDTSYPNSFLEMIGGHPGITHYYLLDFPQNVMYFRKILNLHNEVKCRLAG